MNEKIDKKEQIKAEIKELNKLSKNKYVLMGKWDFLTTVIGLYALLGVLLFLIVF